ncbi:MAG: thermonuclease family protein [Gammaproteobacteria bacterium]|nr:thermonuclease family protein [Gammaproteobacteria bacterium]
MDGDSLLLTDGRQVRLIGINTPEFGKDGVPNDPLAVAARNRTAALTRGQTVRLIYDAERTDRYGRTLAYTVLADGRDLETLLLKEGLAWFVAIAPNVAHITAYRAAETDARHRGIGIWHVPEYQPIPAERLAPNRTGFMRLSGTVSEIKQHRKFVELWLSSRICLVIPNGTDGINPRALAGKHVVARGWVASYKGKQRLRITHNSMLEIPP